MSGHAPPELANANAPAALNEQQLAEYRQVARFLLGRLARESQAVGARLVVLYTPLTPLLEDGKVIWNEQDIGADYAQEQEIMRDVCRELGVPLWNPAEQLTRYVADTGQFPNGFANNRPGYGHLNAAGHRLVAGFLVEELAKLLNQ